MLFLSGRNGNFFSLVILEFFSTGSTIDDNEEEEEDKRSRRTKM
jgi:hypothetical protein